MDNLKKLDKAYKLFSEWYSVSYKMPQEDFDKLETDFKIAVYMRFLETVIDWKNSNFDPNSDKIIDMLKAAIVHGFNLINQSK